MLSSLSVVAITFGLLLSMLWGSAAKTNHTEAVQREQQNTAQPPMAQQRRLHAALNWLNQQLNLNDEQKASLQLILHNEGQQIRSIRENISLTEDQKRDQVIQLHQFTNSEVESILKPDQQQRFTQIKQRTRATYYGNASAIDGSVRQQ